MIVKVCGITCEEDATASIEAGANALGFNFWPGSPRYLPIVQAREFVRDISGVLKVGIFVDARHDEIAAAVEQVGLDVVQLHGRQAMVTAGDLAGGARLWRAHSVREGFTADQLNDPAAEAYLLDAPSGARHGGIGKTFDWSLVHGLRQRIVVAGGLDESNVAEAIRVAAPWGVDACSRLESYPGKKDRQKVAAFVAAALEAAAAAD